MRAAVTRWVAFLSLAIACAVMSGARAQDSPKLRPPVGGVASPVDAMIFYLARGPAGSCGKDCSEWIVAEGTVQWDTHKRLFNFLDRYLDRKRPVVIDTWGDANLRVAVSLGRIIRQRGLDTMVGVTRPKLCAHENEPACFVKKQNATAALDAALDDSMAQCDLTCVMMFAGGVNRSMAAATKVLITGMAVRNRFGTNVSELHQENLTAFYMEQFQRYLVDMQIDPAILDLMKQSTESSHRVELPPRDWWRFRLVTESPL